MEFDKTIENALKTIKKLPFITTRTSQKILFYLLKNKDTYAKELVNAIMALLEIKECRLCNMPTSGEICNICSSPKRDSRVLIIIEDLADLAAIEQMGEYNGKYYILNRRMDIKHGIGPEDLNLNKLIESIKSQSVSEVIFGFDQSPEMEAIRLAIIERLKPFGVSMYTIAVGMPFGSEIEFADKRTIKYALQNRIKIE